MLTAGPYRWQRARADRARRRDQPDDVRRLPRPDRAAGRVRARVPDRRARSYSSGSTRSSCGCATSSVEGDPAPSGQPFPVFGARECLERIREHPLWSRRGELPDGEGIGASVGWWPGGYEPAAAVCRLDADGRLTVITGAADMTGVETAFATIAAEAFGVDPGARARRPRRHLERARTPAPAAAARSPTRSAAPSSAPRSEARERLLEVAAEELEIAPEDLEIVDGDRAAARRARRGRSRSTSSRRRSSPSAARTRRSRATGASRCSQAPQSAAHLSHVRVDPDTGAVTRARARDRPGRRPGAEPRAGRGPDARRHRPGPRLGPARGARPTTATAS